MLTARSDDMDRIRGGIEGAIRYITKPFSVAALRSEVAKALEGEPEPIKRRHAQHAIDVGTPAFFDRREQHARAIDHELRRDPAPPPGAANLPIVR